ncbi:MAG TPA: hypothetical protein VGG03_10870, partial [Thermoanaerobaculia bacterium]
MALRIGPLRFALVLLSLAGLLTAAPLGAACSCSVSASVSPPTLELSGTSSGACLWATSIDLFVDGGAFGNRYCGGSTSCSYSDTKSSACKRTGTHTATAVCGCGNFFPNAEG